MNRVLLTAIFASAVSVLPSTAIAQEHPGSRDGHEQRAEGARTYDDAGHRDRHEWNSREDEEWNRYRGEHHIKQHDFARLKRKQQEEYWKWRHEHGDDRR